jgi:thiol:disulfide interchange protein DsbC
MKNLALFLLIGIATTVSASEKSDIERVREAMGQAVQGITPDSIKPAPMPGFYEVGYGMQFFYVSADGRYAIGGDLVDLKEKTNLTEKRRSDARIALLDLIGKDAIVYPAKDKPKHVITVFTDLDCGYCRKLHAGMREMNDLGIEVRYLAFPRAGAGSPSFKKAVSVWCAKDRNKAMDLAKGGAEPEPAKCENTVAQQYALGGSMGVQGTPAILLEDGRILPGYMPPQRLAQVLNGK